MKINNRSYKVPTRNNIEKQKFRILEKDTQMKLKRKQLQHKRIELERLKRVRLERERVQLEHELERLEQERLEQERLEHERINELWYSRIYSGYFYNLIKFDLTDYNLEYEKILEYNESLKGDIFQDCVICYENIIENTHFQCECRQYYHINCLELWNKINKNCPTCRKDIFT